MTTNDLQIYERAEQLLQFEPRDTGTTQFQMENFLLGSQPTDWGKFRQACVELRSRLQKKRVLKIELELARLDKEEHLKLGNRRGELKAELAQIQIEQLEEQERVITNEIAQFTEAADQLKKLIPEGVSWEDHQEEYWVQKLWRVAWASMVTVGTVPAQVLETIMSLPPSPRMQIMQQLREVGVVGHPASPPLLEELENR